MPIQQGQLAVAVKFSLKEGASIHLADAAYDVPTEELLDQLLVDFRGYLRYYGLDQWRAEIFDCDDFTRQFCAWVGLRNAMRKQSSALPLAIGDVWYHQNGDPSRQHSVAIAYTDRDRILFLETQPNSYKWEPYFSELESAWYARI